MQLGNRHVRFQDGEFEIKEDGAGPWSLYLPCVSDHFLFSTHHHLHYVVLLTDKA